MYKTGEIWIRWVACTNVIPWLWHCTVIIQDVLLGESLVTETWDLYVIRYNYMWIYIDLKIKALRLKKKRIYILEMGLSKVLVWLWTKLTVRFHLLVFVYWICVPFSNMLFDFFFLHLKKNLTFPLWSSLQDSSTNFSLAPLTQQNHHRLCWDWKFPPSNQGRFFWQPAPIFRCVPKVASLT